MNQIVYVNLLITIEVLSIIVDLSFEIVCSDVLSGL